MTICIACRIENHDLCITAPECDCECQEKSARQFSADQQAIIDMAEGDE